MALAKFSKFFREQSEKKREQAEEFLKFQNKRGGRIVLQDIKVASSRVCWCLSSKKGLGMAQVAEIQGSPLLVLPLHMWVKYNIPFPFALSCSRTRSTCCWEGSGGARREVATLVWGICHENQVLALFLLAVSIILGKIK